MVQNQLFLAKEYNISPTEILNMMFFEYEIYLSNVKEIQRKEQEEQKKRDREQRLATPKMPAMPKMSMPKISIPKF